MAKYLCLQRTLPNAAETRERPSPSQMQEMYEAFHRWRAKFQDRISDLGGGLGETRLVTAQPPPDGPLIEVKELVGGYMVVTASSFEEAIQVARECPGLVRPGSGVEVIEIREP
jgi:hypothetical protein